MHRVVWFESGATFAPASYQVFDQFVNITYEVEDGPEENEIQLKFFFHISLCLQFNKSDRNKSSVPWRVIVANYITKEIP